MVESKGSGASIAEKLSPKSQFGLAVKETRGLFEKEYNRLAIKNAIREARVLGEATNMKPENVFNPLVELARDAMEQAIREKDIEGSSDFLEMREGFESTIARLEGSSTPPVSPASASAGTDAKTAMQGGKT